MTYQPIRPRCILSPGYLKGVAALQARFLRTVLPQVESHGRVYFRHLRCQDQREDAIAEMVALSWRWFLRLVKRGKRPEDFPTALATYAARAVRSGRRLTRMERPRDVLSPRAQRLHNFTTQTIPWFPTGPGNPLTEALADNTQTPVPDQVSFRMDFPAWVRTRCHRDRRVIEDLMAGERTGDVADKHGLTAGRVSQLRREFMEDWRRFTDDERDGDAAL